MPDKKTLILDCAIKLLISSGDTGLTLRKLAESADMRLSNVQYYFKSRDDGIVAMVQRYFERLPAAPDRNEPRQNPAGEGGFPGQYRHVSLAGVKRYVSRVSEDLGRFKPERHD